MKRKAKGEKKKENKARRVIGRKGFVLFPWLIFLIAIFVFNLALINLFSETKIKIESIKSLKPVVKFSNLINFFNDYLNISFQVSHEYAFFDYFKNIDKNPNCKIIKEMTEEEKKEEKGKEEKYYFDIKNCRINKDEWLKYLLNNFNASAMNYLNYVNEEKYINEISFNGNCEIGNKENIFCKFELNKTFNLDFVSVNISKEILFDRQYNTSAIEELEKIREEILENLKNIEKSVPNYNDNELKKIKENLKTNYWNVEFYFSNNKIFINIKPKVSKFINYELNFVF